MRLLPLRLAALLILNPACLFAAENPPQIPAFPGAQGAGMYTVGGRFGSVHRVTNLNPSGPGSLADAVSQPNRIVVFTVSGIIDITAKNGKKGGRIDVDQPNITIAGQTAPGEGICIKGGVLNVSASQVILRHLRSRRGFIRDEDSGDSIEIKSPQFEVAAEQEITAEKLAKMTEAEREKYFKRKQKKEGRDKAVHQFEARDHIMLDHLSAGWATDENLTMTHPNFTTAQWCIAAEGLDYANPKQTPPNHSEGGLWGVTADDGRSTLHHMLWAHNRLRNPRTTGGAVGDGLPAVLTCANSVIYNCSEYHSHTGSEKVLLNWFNNYYKPGPDTPPELRGEFFRFHNPDCRMYAVGNVMEGNSAVIADNWKGIHAELKKTSGVDLAKMKLDHPLEMRFPLHIESAEQAYQNVLADAGCTIPCRDPVDLRIINSVRSGGGKIINKETDLPENARWPAYHSLSAPADADEDGIPDFWETQFGLNPNDKSDSMKITSGGGGYANIEHYINNTDPTGGNAQIICITAPISRHIPGKQQGQWRITRTGPTDQPLTVHFKCSIPIGTESATIPVGKAFVDLPLNSAPDQKGIVLVELAPGKKYKIGCPAASLVAIEK